jgi:hypothetical protein
MIHANDGTLHHLFDFTRESLILFIVYVHAFIIMVIRI